MEDFFIMRTHIENLDLYLSSGGDPKIARIHKIATISNRAKMEYLVSKLDQKKNIVEEKRDEVDVPVKMVVKTPTIIKEVPKIAGLITQYPPELHSIYHELEFLWSEYCEMKLVLNDIPPHQEKEALSIQNKIFKIFERFDKHKKVLDHYVKYKHILPTESKRNFDNMTQLELDLERRNLAALICRRKQTIKKMQGLLPEETDPAFNKRVASINHKKEQLQILILDQEKIIQLLHN